MNVSRKFLGSRVYIFACVVGLAGACTTMPPTPQYAGEGGYALVECVVQGDGKPLDCRVKEESHANMGFGAEAVAIVSSGALSRHAEYQALKGTKFTVRVPFALAVEDRESSEPSVS